MDSDEKWYSVKEVAARWSVHHSSIERMCNDGKLRWMLMEIQAKRRKRKYFTRRISESECRRYERTHIH